MTGAVSVHPKMAATPTRRAFVCAVFTLGMSLSGCAHVDKINVAAIGNIVNQLHVHIVGRNRGDVAWPGTVWACDEKKPFSDVELLDLQTRFTLAFNSARRG
jgi:hypothetical protein